jgi:hypothetical protein
MKKETKETKGEEFTQDPERTIQSREMDLDNIFGKYYREVPEDVIRYMRKNPALIFQRLYDTYGDKAYDYLDRASEKKNKMFVKEGEVLKGGKADNKSLSDLAKKHNLPIMDMKKELSKGVKTEMEHTDNKRKATEIAMDHLYEDPKYYDKLKKIESSISRKNFYYFDSIQKSNFSNGLKNGDVIAFLATRNDLDFKHVGFVYIKNNKKYILHASQEKKNVCISDLTIDEYLLKNRKIKGFQIYRPTI